MSLLTDGSFEDNVANSSGGGGNPSWFRWNSSTPDYLDNGSEPAWWAFQTPTDGDSYVGLVTGPTWREGISQDLDDPLTAGNTYTLTFDAEAGKYAGVTYNSEPAFDGVVYLEIFGSPVAGQVGTGGTGLPQGAVSLGSVAVSFNGNNFADGMSGYTFEFTPTFDIQTLSFAPVYGGEYGQNEAIAIDNVMLVCFTRGTRILTDEGEKEVETLSPGDLIQTLDNGLQPVRWISKTKRQAKGKFAPICIKRGTLDNKRDLYVSPQHKMLLTGRQAEVLFGEEQVLASAVSLLNDITITRAEGGEVEYFHVLFDQHEIIYAEGSPTESFYPGETTLSQMDRNTYDELIELFPELEIGGTKAYGEPAKYCLKSYETALMSKSLILSDG
ncbi:MAG: Hint domain-containing protein [Hyphomicrobiales bacterium]